MSGSNPYYDDDDGESAFGRPSGGDDSWGGFGNEDLSAPPPPLTGPPAPPARPPAPPQPHAAPRPAQPSGDHGVPDWAMSAPPAYAQDTFAPAPTYQPPQPTYQPPQQPYQPAYTPPPSRPVPQPEAPKGRFSRPSKDDVAEKARQKAKGASPHSPNMSGGRFIMKARRALTWAVLVVLLLGGLKNVVSPDQEPDTEAIAKIVAADLGSTGFPTETGSAIAIRYAKAYLTLEPDGLDTRADALAQYGPSSLDSGSFNDWNGQGNQQIVLGPVVAAPPIQEGPDNQRVVLAALTGEGQWLYLSVPLYADPKTRAVTISGPVGIVPAPPHAELPVLPAVVEDKVATEALALILPDFFDAWAASDQPVLNQYVLSGADVGGGLGGVVDYSTVRGIQVPEGGDDRTATATVDWTTAGGAILTQSYQLQVTYQPAAQKWFVKSLVGGVDVTKAGAAPTG